VTATVGNSYVATFLSHIDRSSSITSFSKLFDLFVSALIALSYRLTASSLPCVLGRYSRDSADLEWCGAASFLFMTTRYLDAQKQKTQLDARCHSLEAAISSESSSINILRKQLKQVQTNAEDTEWQLQDQLAHASNILLMEREANAELRNRIAATEAKLVEVEMFLASDRGAVTLQLEEELAEARLQVAALEAEKDELELDLRRSQQRHRALQSKENDKSFPISAVSAVPLRGLHETL
jgi:acetolactate synthase regulatory subunit